MQEDLLTKLQPPFIHKWSVSQDEVSNFALRMAMDKPNYAIRVLRGKKMPDTGALFDEFAGVMQFPYYFGYNGNAFRDCLMDLAWIVGSAYVLIIQDAVHLLEREGVDGMNWFLSAMHDVATEWSKPIELGEWWDRPGRPFHVLLHVLPGDETLLEQRLKSSSPEKHFIDNRT